MAKFTYMLAPMEDFTDCAFRMLCHNHGADLTFTEMSRVSALAQNNKSTLSRIEIKDQTPTAIQLLALKEEELKKFLGNFSRRDKSQGFRGFNLNLGCPSPEIIQLGMGCALIKRVAKVKNLIKAIHDFGYPVSIKMRLGMNGFEKSKKAYLNLINHVDAEFFIIHGRHGMQTYSDPCDFSVFEECAKTGKGIIANGDIKTKEQADFLKGVGAKGLMVGRAALSNPAIFDLLKGQVVPELKKLKAEYLEISSHIQAKEKYVQSITKLMGRDNLFKYANK